MNAYHYILICVLGFCGIGLFIPAVPRALRTVAVVVVLLCGLFSLFGIQLTHRLAWYSPKRSQHIAYSEPDKRIFEEGVTAASDSAHKFVPGLLLSLLLLTAAAISAGRSKA